MILALGHIPEFVTLSFIKYFAKHYSTPGTEPDPREYIYSRKKIMSLTPSISLSRKDRHTNTFIINKRNDKCSTCLSSFRGSQLPQVPVLFTLTSFQPHTQASHNQKHVFAQNSSCSTMYLWARHLLCVTSLCCDLCSITLKSLWSCQYFISIFFPAKLFVFLLSTPFLSSLDLLGYFFKYH